MICNLLSLSLLVGWSQFLSIVQSAAHTQSEHQQIQISARLAHRTLAESVYQAGQYRSPGYLTSPVVGELAIDSDLTGNSGDPDGALAHPFEMQRFRMNPDFLDPMTGADFDRVGNMQWKSGSGSFQPFVSHITRVRFQIEEGPLPRFVTIKLQMRGRLQKQGGTPQRSFQLTSSVEKNRDQWFRYDLPPF